MFERLKTATGRLAAGVWVEHRDQGLHNFWILSAPALLVAALVVASGLHHFAGNNAHDERAIGPPGPPVAAVLILAMLIAVNVCLLVRFITILLVRRFPDQAPQAWGGAAVFATGITGAGAAFAWGFVAATAAAALLVSRWETVAAPSRLDAREPSVS